MSYDNWFEKYKPVMNHITNEGENGSYNGRYFETHGKELEYVQQFAETNPNKVWTLLTGTECGDVLTNGFHYVNRYGYFITEVPFEGDDVEIYMDGSADDGFTQEDVDRFPEFVQYILTTFKDELSEDATEETVDNETVIITPYSEIVEDLESYTKTDIAQRKVGNMVFEEFYVGVKDKLNGNTASSMDKAWNDFINQ